MGDKEFKKQMTLCLKYHGKYFKKLNIIEKEYKRRFNCYPSNVDDDVWIDTFHVPTEEQGGNMSNEIFEMITKSAITSKNNKLI